MVEVGHNMERGKHGKPQGPLPLTSLRPSHAHRLEASHQFSVLPPKPPAPTATCDEQAQEIGSGVTQSTNPWRVLVAAVSITQGNLGGVFVCGSARNLCRTGRN